MAHPPRTPTPEQGSGGPPVRVLIVDDDAGHAETVADVLEPLGCDTTVVGSGEAGVKRVESEEFDVVITDLKMGPGRRAGSAQPPPSRSGP